MMRRISCAATATKWVRFCQRAFVVVDQPQVGFIEKRGGLQRVTGAVPAHVMVRQPVQFGLHQRDQLPERSFVTASPMRRAVG